ncbi:BTAD domain-containing putative transcriptional regulator [Amycolatopsis sp. NPDC059657]|uniref:BTAD domain-containing putative transcriptional regulator n=1 Tax=Amycolatopsis sp. NPDC059657 TaxID=3346899 RepID=UPI00366B5E2D
MDTDWHIRLLGPLSLSHGSAEVGLRSTPQRVILAVLALAGAVSRQELVDAVWGGNRPPSAASNVYTYISGLRQALEPGRLPRATDGLIRSSGTGYSLEIDCDVHRFRALRAGAARFREAGRHEAALADLESAMDLWRGEALAGLPGPFAAAERADLEELRLATAEGRAEILLELGRHGEAVPGLSALCREHPLRERPHELLMRALHRGGRTAEALEVFASARSALVAASGLEPGPELRKLHQELLGGGVRAASVSAPRPALFVGREPELKVLRDAVADVLAGRGSVLSVVGEPGIGKTALLAEALADVPVQPATVDTPEAPAVLVADDFDEADEVTRARWRRFTRMPGLLLISATRSGREVIGRPVPLSPFTEYETRALAGPSVPYERLAQASGNPRYIREIAASRPPELVKRIDEHLTFLTPSTRSVLQRAALLGETFTFADLATTVGRPPLAGHVAEAVAMGVLAAEGMTLRFRHPVVQAALREGLPGSLRAALHIQFAAALARAGAPPDRVTRQLTRAHG